MSDNSSGKRPPRRGSRTACRLATTLRAASSSRWPRRWSSRAASGSAQPETIADTAPTEADLTPRARLRPAELRPDGGGARDLLPGLLQFPWLWPLFHGRADLLELRAADLDGYRAVNKRNGTVSVAGVIERDDLIWVQDYSTPPAAWPQEPQGALASRTGSGFPSCIYPFSQSLRHHGGCPMRWNFTGLAGAPVQLSTSWACRQSATSPA